MKPQRIRTQVQINRDEWIEYKLPPNEIESILKHQLIEKLSKELINQIDITKESNSWVGEEWKVDITVMSTDEYRKLIDELIRLQGGATETSGYHCSTCGKYNRTSVICNHNSDFNKMINKLHETNNKRP
jgi:hypothetical protein